LGRLGDAGKKNTMRSQDPYGRAGAAPVVFVESKLLVEMKLENYKRNRETCPPAHRDGFDQLIAIAEAELTHAAAD
jgi:hypothetical protein